ncbi:MAG TPA: MFS transporter, partial [Acidimicrobiales bacterium]|nr:MFS transporter [Acidimicrobiales bacterium]
MRASTTTPKLDGAEYKRRWLAMPFIALGVAMIIVDATIVNVAVPTIIRELHVSATTAEWFNSIYALVFASLLISLGHTGDVWGRRRLFFVGTVIFVLASLVAAMAPNSDVLIVGRFLQGIGGAMILPATLSTVNATFVGHDRAIAFAIWGSTIGGVAALGPLLGGWLTTDYSWRWAFLINLPIGAVVLAGIVFVVPETRDLGVRRGIDWWGNLLVIVGLATLVFGLIEGSHYGWWHQVVAFRLFGAAWPASGPSPIAVSFIVSAVALASFVILEQMRRRRGAVVLVDLGLFRIRSFAAGNIAVAVVALGEFGLLFVLPLFLQGVLGYSALDTGLLFLALALGTFVVGGLTPQLARRIGARGVARLGLGLEVVGIAGLGLILSPSVGAWDMVPWLFVYGLGVGMATAQLTGVILADVPVVDSGQAAGVQSTARQVGSALGIAILGTILVTSLASHTRAALDTIPGRLPPAMIDRVVHIVRTSGGAAVDSLAALPRGEQLVHAASVAAVDATRTVALAAAAFIFV